MAHEITPNVDLEGGVTCNSLVVPSGSYLEPDGSLNPVEWNDNPSSNVFTQSAVYQSQLDSTDGSTFRVTASSYYWPNEGQTTQFQWTVDKAFSDGATDSNTHWVTANSFSSSNGYGNAWLNYEVLDGPKVLNKYYIASKGNVDGKVGHAPRDWTLQGYESGVGWRTLDTVVDGSITKSNGSYTGYFYNTKQHTQYRLTVTRNNSTGAFGDTTKIAVRAWMMFETPTLDRKIIGDATNVKKVPTITPNAISTNTTDASNFAWVINENDLSSNSADKVPTQSSVKSYVEYTLKTKSIGFRSGGFDPTYTNSIDSFEFASNTTATDHGNLTLGRNYLAGHSSDIQGFSSSGFTGSPTYHRNTIDKFSFSSTSGATDHGDTSVTRSNPSGSSSQYQGFTSGGNNASNVQSVIDKFDFATTGNSVDHGDLVQKRHNVSGHQSNTQGFSSCGVDSGHLSSIEKFDFSTNVTANSHGDDSEPKNGTIGCSSPTQGFIGGGRNGSNTHLSSISVFDFSNNVTATSHGDFTTTVDQASSSSGDTQGFVHGGDRSGLTNIIEKFDYSSNVTATDHGDLSQQVTQSAGHEG
jgi:hypothetical protein